MDDRTPPPDSKLTQSKLRWAQERREPPGKAGSGGRIPPGQHEVRNWPVLDLGEHPRIDPNEWRLEIDGLVASPRTLDWTEFSSLAQDRLTSDIHCVTSWSRLDNEWTGLAALELLELVEPLDQAQAVMLHSVDGYTTNVAIADLFAPGVLLAHSWQGEPLTREHGGPVRLVVPHLYFWKSAKWLTRIEFLPENRPGFWEVNGYHLRGDPWLEERYS